MDKEKLLEAANKALLINLEIVENSKDYADKDKDFATRAVSTLTHTIEALSAKEMSSINEQKGGTAMSSNIIKRSRMEEAYDKQNPKELPLALKLIETAESEGATVSEFLGAMARAKTVVMANQNVSFLGKLQGNAKADL